MLAATICSGIGAPEVAMPHWSWIFASDIEAAPRAIMAYRHGAEDASRARSGTGPALWGDFTAIRGRFLRRLGIALPQWLVAGTPCQSFSIAGLRGGMADARGNLTMEFLRLVHALRRAGSLKGFLWENVPGILSHADNPFGCFLAGIVGSDTPIVSPLKRGRWSRAGMVDGPFGKAAWVVKDAQYFGLAQRRARVLVVASFVDGIDPAAVLFERCGVSGNNPPRREQREDVAVSPTLRARANSSHRGDSQAYVAECFGGGNTSGPIERAACLTAKGQRVDFEVETFVTHALRGEGFDASEDGTGRGTPIVPVDLTNGSIGADIAGTIEHAQHKSNRGQAVLQPISFNSREDFCHSEEVFGSLGSSSPQAQAVAYAIQAGATRENPAAGPDGVGVKEDVAYTLEARAEVQAVAFSIMPMNSGKDYKARETDIAQPLMAGGPVGGNQGGDYIQQQMGVRRLMPVECERLQGFPDHFTAIPYRSRKVTPDEAAHAAIEGRLADCTPDGDLVTDCMADGPRYKALGNSMPVNMIRFYLQRVERMVA
ncbi:DNA cytosine methyltransferase [Sphingobium agri]|uniref:DNA (cytosine-5-)-methyltransferase n=1 Tax=Sphingobium agri TaxID=2933566 RepID=A0ABT0DWL6_9SPHN|nr:DNA cytosine methyltransferase [Sphingobium agri]MCK0531483.1 DNA cytosine methyltransferase [Sphingobium agri]